jgi:hypothetical protein
VTTHRGDQHLTVGVPAFLARYEQHVRNTQIVRMIVDREGMATEFLANLHAEGRNVVTILQTNQYRDLTSFSDVGTFVPLSTDAHGQVIREVAPASITLSREDHPDSPLCLQVALIRDLRRAVSVRPDPEEAQYPQRWDSDLPLDERTWWREGWQATAAPAKETTRDPHPIVTTVQTQPIDAIELAQTSIHRWPEKTKHHQGLFSPLGIGHESRLCQSGGGEFGSCQTTSTPGAASCSARVSGHRARASARRKPADDESNSALHTISESQGAVSSMVGISAQPGRTKPDRVCVPTEAEANAKPRSMPNWNRSASKSGKPMNNATTSSASKNATAKSSAKFSVHEKS